MLNVQNLSDFVGSSHLCHQITSEHLVQRQHWLQHIIREWILFGVWMCQRKNSSFRIQPMFIKFSSVMWKHCLKNTVVFLLFLSVTQICGFSPPPVTSHTLDHCTTSTLTLLTDFKFHFQLSLLTQDSGLTSFFQQARNKRENSVVPFLGKIGPSCQLIFALS